jgi:PAS domain S-box-containing protein
MDDAQQIRHLKKQLEDLEIQRQILRVQQEESLDGILVVDSHWIMRSYNQRFVDMWEIPQHILDSKDDRASIATVLAKLKNPSQFMAQVEYLMLHPREKSLEVLALNDGRYFQRSSSPIIDTDKSFSGRIWFFRDITESKKAEEGLQLQNQQLEDMVSRRTGQLQIAKDKLEEQVEERTLKLKQEQDRLQAITESVPGVVFQCYHLKNGEEGITYTNSRLLDIFGMEFMDDPPRLLHEFIANIHPSHRESFVASIAEVVENRGPWEWRGRYVRPSGRTIWFEGHALPVIHSDGIYLNGFLFDITEKIEQEVQRLKTTRQQEELNKIECLRTMAGAIAHKFNNSMMAVQGNLELLSLSLPKGSTEHCMAQDAFKAASGASQVGSMMLSYVGQKKLDLHETSLVTFVREYIKTVTGDLPPTIKLSFLAPDQSLSCILDPMQFKEVIHSVVRNGIESLPESGGTVEISFGVDSFAVDELPVLFRNGSERYDVFAFCQVRDNGCGILEENLNKIFEPFFTTKFVGRGLGLALTVGIMQRHNGAIIVESAKGEGTTVRVLLPLSSQEQVIEPLSCDILPAEEKPLSGTILIVDDEPILLMVCKMMLEQLGLTVHTACNGLDAVARVRAGDTDYCAILLDVQMPGMDGIKAMIEIRKICNTIPILLISGFSKTDTRFDDYSQVECDGFIEKPVQLSELRRKLEEALG